MINLKSSPTHSLNILSLNVRSLLPKFDEFCLALINYQLFRKDRNRHGGDVLLYIHSNIFAVPLKLSCDLELLLVSVKVFNQTIIDLLPYLMAFLI